MLRIARLLIVALVVGMMPNWTAAEEAEDAEVEAKVEEFLASIVYQKGRIDIGDDLATLNIPDSFQFVGSEQAETILALWGNPPGGDPPLGMIFPAGKTAQDVDTWAVVIQWSEDGYVKDDDAASIDYGQLLEEMKEGVRESSEARVKDGYPGLELVGWATPPRYDPVAHKMYWAKELKFDGEGDNTLNYNIRILGRKGVLVLNAVASMTQLSTIEAATPQLLSLIDFKEGQRYADFDPGTDHYAAYGLAALVAGKVAAKAGLFKGLLALLIAGKKFVAVGVVALLAFVRNYFGRNKASA